MTDELGIGEYRALLDEVLGGDVVKWTAEAEESERVPRKLIEYLGQRGVFAQKWRNGQHPDLAKLVALAIALGKLGSAGIGVGVSLHDSAVAILRRFARSDSDGSDLQIVQTEIRSLRGGFAVKGIKKYVSLSSVAASGCSASPTRGWWSGDSSARRCSSIRRCGCASPICRRASTCSGTGSTESPLRVDSICGPRRR